MKLELQQMAIDLHYKRLLARHDRLMMELKMHFLRREIDASLGEKEEKKAWMAIFSISVLPELINHHQYQAVMKRITLLLAAKEQKIKSIKLFSTRVLPELLDLFRRREESKKIKNEFDLYMILLLRWIMSLPSSAILIKKRQRLSSYDRRSYDDSHHRILPYKKVQKRQSHRYRTFHF